MSKLPELCDFLRLHLLVISDDLSYHFKFMDIVTRRAEDILSDDGGNVHKDK